MRKFNHLIFWVIVIGVLTITFGHNTSHYAEAFYFVAMLLPIIVGTSYFFNYFLVPNYLLNKAYFKFVLFTIYTLIISIYLEMLIVILSFVLLANYQYDKMNPVTTNVLLLAIILYFIVFLNAFILLIKQSFSSKKKIMILESDRVKQEEGYLLIRANRKMNKIMHTNIAYVESLSDYVKIIKSEDDEAVVTKEKISTILDKLPDSFYRIHRSFIVNSAAVTSFSKESVLINNKSLPISRTYKKEIAEKLTFQQSDE